MQQEARVVLVELRDSSDKETGDHSDEAAVGYDVADDLRRRVVAIVEEHRKVATIDHDRKTHAHANEEDVPQIDPADLPERSHERQRVETVVLVAIVRRVRFVVGR